MLVFLYICPFNASTCCLTLSSAVFGHCFPAFGADITGLHVTLAGVLESEGWASDWPRSTAELSIEDVFRQVAVLHAPYMAQPAQASLAQQRIHAADPICHCRRYGPAEDTFGAPHEEGVEAALLARVCGPRFAAIEEGGQHTGLVDAHLGVLSEHLIFPYSFGQLGHSDCGFSDAPIYLSFLRKVVGDV